MHRDIIIEWKHIGKDVENTCERCGETGAALIQAIEKARPALEKEGISIRIIETLLPDERIAESNSIFFNGMPFEDLIGGMVTSTPCCSCACIVDAEEVECRAVDHNGAIYQSIPPELIFEVIERFAAAMREEVR